MNDKPRILIVDDDQTARITLEVLLLRENYELVFASSGQEVVANIEEIKPDVILLDVMMPGMNGFEVCAYLKGNNTWRHIPIILITALDSLNDLTHGLDTGADEFLTKPVTGPELRARVRSMLRIKEQHDELARMMQLREDMARMIVHDMRNPLHMILGFSEILLSEDTMAEEHLHDICRINKQAQRLEMFITDLLLLAKMEKGQVLLDRTEVDLKELVGEVGQEYRILAQASNINLNVDLPLQNSLPVSLDTSLFRRVLGNLLTNAFKYSKSDTNVTLQLDYCDTNGTSQGRESKAKIMITDEGMGIAPADRNRIFDMYEVVDSANERAKQTGLGLAFCKMVTEAHEGRIWVEGNQPQGSVFIVEI
jgi:signal transduction histidine kinase